jgi:hypothetical protein
MDEIDIWRGAQLMVKRYGENAVIQAAMRAAELLEQGDFDGQDRAPLPISTRSACGAQFRSGIQDPPDAFALKAAQAVANVRGGRASCVRRPVMLRLCGEHF